MSDRIVLEARIEQAACAERVKHAYPDSYISEDFKDGIERAARIAVEMLAPRIEDVETALAAAVHENGELRAALARVREMHDQYLPAAVDYDCCAHCNIGGIYVEWPCPTIRALDGEEKPLFTPATITELDNAPTGTRMPKRKDTP